MKSCSTSIASVLLACLAQIIASAPTQNITAPAQNINAPTQNTAALVACVKLALLGQNVESRIVTSANDTYADASVGDIL